MTVNRENTSEHDEDSEIVVGQQVVFEKDKQELKVTVVELATSEFHHKQIIIQ